MIKNYSCFDNSIIDADRDGSKNVGAGNIFSKKNNSSGTAEFLKLLLPTSAHLRINLTAKKAVWRFRSILLIK